MKDYSIYDYENEIEDDYTMKEVDQNEKLKGFINYGGNNYKKCAPSLEDYDGNGSQEY